MKTKNKEVGTIDESGKDSRDRPIEPQSEQRRTDRATVGESACDCREITISSER